MFFFFLSVVVPVAIWLFLPPLITYLFKLPAPSRLLLLVGGLCFFISWYLPSPLIEGRDTNFTTHFVGGGIFCGFVWLYLKRHLQLSLSPLIELVTLYAVVSSLGVANELFELVITKIHFVSIDPSDTWWDFVANSLGSLAFWMVYRGYLLATKK